jgi:hypothetical protein
MTPLLRLYLSLEQSMLVAEAIDDRLADSIRDAMDPIWDALSDDEHRVLDERKVHFIRSLEGLRVSAGADLYCAVPDPAERRTIPKEPIEGWRRAA